MSWEERMIGDAELRPDLTGEAPNSFRARVRGLIAQQCHSWPMLRDAIAGLAEVQYRRLLIKGSETMVQFNPKRIVSTAARVDQASIKQRPCFLCLENLPPEELGLRFNGDFVVLCNPFPVLADHLVVASLRHTPQAIAGHFEALLDLTSELGAGWFTIYNGPRCGASAPDHLHFQAASLDLLPILREIGSWHRQEVIKSETLEAFTLRDYRLNLLVLRSRHRRALIGALETALGRLAEIAGSSEEPMVNMVLTCEGTPGGTSDDRGWTVIVFPRSKHRPSCYDADDSRRLTVSPAAIDLSGVMVVPQPEHFTRITAQDVERIFAEVTLGDARFDEWIRRLEN